MEIREELHNDLIKTQNSIKEEYEKLKKLVPSAIKSNEKFARVNNGLIEYYGPKNPSTVLVAMGSLVGTIKDTVDEINKGIKLNNSVGIMKIKSFRPFPKDEILNIIKKSDRVAVIEKAISLGATDGPLALDLKAAAKNNTVAKVQSFIVGLGGRDITKKMIKNIVAEVKKNEVDMKFVGKE